MPSTSLAADFRSAARARKQLSTPIEFLRLCGMDPDPWQRDVLQSSARNIILACSRQSGKSTVTAALAMHMALTQPGAEIVLVSKAERQAQNLLRACMRLYRKAGSPVPIVGEGSKSHVEFQNASHIFALPGTSEGIRSFAALSLLAVDEAAFAPDELYYAVRPMLAVSNGKCILLSSPHGKRGFFWEAWDSVDTAARDGDTAGWERYKITAYECPRISHEFLEEEKRKLGPWWFSQEYMAEFIAAESQPFTQEDVDKAFTEEVEAWAL